MGINPNTTKVSRRQCQIAPIFSEKAILLAVNQSTPFAHSLGPRSPQAPARGTLRKVCVHQYYRGFFFRNLFDTIRAEKRINISSRVTRHHLVQSWHLTCLMAQYSSLRNSLRSLFLHPLYNLVGRLGRQSNGPHCQFLWPCQSICACPSFWFQISKSI